MPVTGWLLGIGGPLFIWWLLTHSDFHEPRS